MREPVEKENVVSTAARLLQRACSAFDKDRRVARLQIQRALELLLESVGTIEMRPAPADQRTQGLAPWQARRVTDLIQAHLEMPIRVEDMANATRLSTSYFFRAFKHSFSVSPHAYVLALRLARAKELLSESDEQISQVAMACGFADQAHFSRVFRRETGCAPGHWRRERRTPFALAESSWA